MTSVLFLDSDWRPLRVASWQRAISDLFSGKIEVLVYSKDKTIQGVTESYPMPSVVRVLRRFNRKKIAIKFSRLNIYSRDRFVCQYCGKRFMSEDLTFDHVNPRSKGGKTTWNNIVAACVPCNTQKADRTLAEAGMRLLRKPVKPDYLPVVSVRMSSSRIPAEWKDYWSGPLEA